jgi:hypothetical protein
VRHVQLEPVKAGLARAPRGRGEERRQLLGQLRNVREVEVGHALTRPHVQVLELPRGQHLLQVGAFEGR